MLSVIIPAYNEEKSIEQTLTQIKNTLVKGSYDHEIIVIDDGSTDKTREVISKVKDIKSIHHDFNKGYGASLKDGIRLAKGNYIFITDADGTYPIDKMPELISASKNYDMVVGARETANVPFLRKPAKKILSLLANILTKSKIPDLNSGFRIFRRDLAINFYHLFPEGFSFTTTITLAALTNGYSVKYVQIPYHKRIGKSSITPWNFFEFVVLIFRIVMYFNPLKFFLVSGLILLFIGLGSGIIQVIKIHNLGELPILLIIIGLQICFLGLIADLIVKSRRDR